MTYRILFLCMNLFPVGGTAARVLGFARALAYHGDEVCVADCQSHGIDLQMGSTLDVSQEGMASMLRLNQDAVDFRLLRAGYARLRQYARPLHKLLTMIKYLMWAMALIRGNDFDIVYCTMQTSIVGFLLRRISSVRVVVDLHSTMSLEAPNILMRRAGILFEKCLCGNADCVLVPTQELKQLYTSWGVMPHKIHVVRNALGTLESKPVKSRQQIRRELAISNEDTVVVFLGVISSDNRYNIESLLVLDQISKIMIAHTGNVRFLIVGYYDQKPVRDEHFVYTGYVQNLADYLSAADFAILPIFSNSLGIRSRLIEYFGSYLPVVTTPAGVTGMQFAEEAGVAVVRESIEDMAVASLELVRSPDRLRRMKNDCRRVMNEFDPTLVAAQLHHAFAGTA